LTLPLRTVRLVLRAFTGSDLADLAAVFADPAVLWWEPTPLTREQTAAWIESVSARYEADGLGEYAVTLRSSGQVLGYCGPELRDIEGDLLPELGWALRSDVWGRGYATEAAAAVVGHLREMGLPAVYSAILPGNVRSQGVARRLGMTVERVVDWHGAAHDLWSLDLA
jgi:RimJ/RimL family protein N-acetyltransferase